MSDDKLPDLTPKQHAFVKGLLQGMTASDAYRTSYDCTNMSEPALWVEASRLKNDPNIALWLEASKTQALTERSYGLQEHMKDLEEAIRLCRDNGNYGAMVKATELLGRASGVYIERIQTETNEADLVKTLKDLGQPGREIARDLGIELPEEVTKH